MFALIAVEAQRRDRPNPLLLFDLVARDGLLGGATARGWRPIARAVSRLTGEGLAVVVGLAVLALALVRRRRDAWVVLLGAAGAWAASGILKLGLACVAIAVAAGVSRVVLNAHWPSDILGGLVFGTAWLNLVTLVAARGDAR